MTHSCVRSQPRRTIPRRSSSHSQRMTSARRATSCAPSGSRPAASTAGSRWRSTRRSPTTASAPSSRLSASTRRSDATTSTSRFPPRSSVSARSRTASQRASRSTSRSSSRSQRYREVAEAYVRGLERLVAAGGDPSRVPSVASFFVSRVDSRGRQAAGGYRAAGPAGQARDREREARLPALPRDVRGRALGLPGGKGRASAALPVGVHLDQEPRLPRRALRRGADRAGYRQHDADRDGARLPGSRRDPRGDVTGRHRRGEAAARRSGGGGRRLRRRGRDARGRRRDRSSPTRSASCSRGSPRSRVP